MNESFEGGCHCGRLRYRMTSAPITVNCCHCRDCQRLTGAAFALNAMIETERVVPLGEAWSDADVIGSDLGARQWRCATCGVLLWADHAWLGDGFRFVRVGTLDQAERWPPDAHYFVRSKHPWIVLPDGVASFQTLPADGMGPDLDPARRARLDAGLARSRSSMARG